MRLYIKDSKGDNRSRFLIFDELSNLQYKVSVEKTALTIKLDIFDNHSNNRVAKIRKRDILFLKTYTISCKDKKIKVIGKFSESDVNFYINGINWFFMGDILKKDFEVINVDKSVIMSHKQRVAEAEVYYEINVNDENNKLLCICIALCIEILNVDTELGSKNLLKNKAIFKKEALPQKCFKINKNIKVKSRRKKWM